MKGLSQTFEAMPTDDDDELWPVQSTTPRPEPQPASPAPPASGEEAYRSRMAMMFEHNNKQQDKLLTDKLPAWKVAIDEETTTKMNNIEAKLDNNIDEVMRTVATVTERLRASSSTTPRS